MGEAPASDMMPSRSGSMVFKKGTIFLKIEYISDKEGKLIVAGPRLAAVAALALLTWSCIAKFNDDPNFLMRDDTLQKVSTPIAAACVAAVLATALLLISRLLWARASHMAWTNNRQKPVMLASLRLTLQGINATLWLTNMAYMWANECSWLSKPVNIVAGLQWSMLNTLFLLNILEASHLLPPGSWTDLFYELKDKLTCQKDPSQTDDSFKAGAGEEAAQEAAAAANGSTTPGDGLGGFLQKATDVRGNLARIEKLVHRSAGFLALVLLWVPTEALILFLTIDTVKDAETWSGWRCGNPFDPACWPSSPDCRQWDWDCSPTQTITNVTWGMGAMMNLNGLVFLAVIGTALHQLGKKPYNDYRVQNLAARIMIRTRVLTYVMFTLTLILTWYIRLGTCSSLLLTWAGSLGPMQICMTVTVVAESLLYMPCLPDENSLKLHDSLQKFSWTEREMPEMLVKRGFEDEEPSFCFETALKTAYLSLHTYRHFNTESTVTSIQNAMALYGCTHYEWLRETTHDSNCLLLWGPDALVIAFRGTASMANAKADLNAWRSAHPPTRGSFWLGQMPLVHRGFLKSWLAKDFNNKVLNRVHEILESKLHSNMEGLDCSVDRCCKGEGQEAEEGNASVASPSNRTMPYKIVLAGHSLGGAMSQLCGIDLAKALPGWGFRITPASVPLKPGAPDADRPAVSLSTYTFGAPRTGNRAFARDYKEHMPDCWSIINGQDAVANQAKFLVLFKRAGFPVLLSRRGDLIVRPSTIEHTAHRTSGVSVKQHMLFGSYCPSLAAVLKAQMEFKPMPGGQEALEHLSEEGSMVQLLHHMLGLAVGKEEASAEEAAALAAEAKAARAEEAREAAS